MTVEHARGLRKDRCEPVRRCLARRSGSALALWALIALMLCGSNGTACPAAPVVFTLRQPDGTAFQARLAGDEWGHWTETVGGHTIARDEGTGRWVYAERSASGELIPGRHPVGEEPPVGMDQHVRPAALPRTPLGAAANLMPGVSYAPPSQGIHNVLVLVVDFTPSVLVGTSPATWSDAVFGSSGSVADHYDEITYGQILLAAAAESDASAFGGAGGATNDGIVYVQLGYEHPNTGGSTGNANRQLVHDAIAASDAAVDYSRFDANQDGFLSTDELHIVTVVAGCEMSYGIAGVPNVWAHQWSLGSWYDENDNEAVDAGEVVPAPVVDDVAVGHFSGGASGTKGGYTQLGEWHGVGPFLGHPATIGVISHELGHDMGSGVPDLYDTDMSSMGIGDWCLQASGAWNRTAQLGDTPSHWCAWAKWYLGLLVPTQLTEDTHGLVFPRVEDATGANRGVFQALDNPDGVDFDWWGASGTGEYFLIENRQQVGYDAGLPGSGLCIWHICEATPTDNTANDNEGSMPPGNPRLVAMEQMDGTFDLEGYGLSGGANRGDAGDPWIARGQFGDASTPNSRLYSGSSTWVTVTGISESSATMTADILLPPSPTVAVFRVTQEGHILTDGTIRAATVAVGSADVAEWVAVSEPVEPGDVLELDPSNPGQYRKTRGPCSLLIAGVVSTEPGVVLGSEVVGSPVSSSTLNLARRTSHSALMALIGIVPVKACAEGGAIEPGDLLVTASIPGYVRRWNAEEEAAPDCPLVGKAIEPLIEGEGVILVLLTR